MTNTVKTRRPSKKAVAKAVAPLLAMMPSLPLLPHIPGIVAFPTEPLDTEAFSIPGEAAILSDDEFEAAMRSLEDAEAPATYLALYEEAEDVALAGPDVVSFADRLALVSEPSRNAMAHDCVDRIDSRIAVADGKAVKNLERARKVLARGGVAKVLCAAGLADGAFVSRQWNDGKQFNVYAVMKLGDLANGLLGGLVTNAVNIAVVKSMFALEAAGISFDLDTAKAAASTSHTPKRPGVRQHLTRHTVAAGTALTQAGSTMHALMALGIVHFTHSQNPTYTILDTPQTAALRTARFEAADEE